MKPHTGLRLSSNLIYFGQEIVASLPFVPHSIRLDLDPQPDFVRKSGYQAYRYIMMAVLYLVFA